MTNGITIEEAKEHRAVEGYVERHDDVGHELRYLRVRPYGNATLMNNLARSSHVRLQNTGVNDDGTLRVHVKPLGQ